MLSNIFTSNPGKRKQGKLSVSESEQNMGDAVDRLKGKAAAQRDLCATGAAPQEPVEGQLREMQWPAGTRAGGGGCC